MGLKTLWEVFFSRATITTQIFCFLWRETVLGKQSLEKYPSTSQFSSWGAPDWPQCIPTWKGFGHLCLSCLHCHSQANLFRVLLFVQSFQRKIFVVNLLLHGFYTCHHCLSCCFIRCVFFPSCLWCVLMAWILTFLWHGSLELGSFSVLAFECSIFISPLTHESCNVLTISECLDFFGISF